jgi:uncharacterized repeat protein (TIGR03803 family)
MSIRFSLTLLVFAASLAFAGGPKENVLYSFENPTPPNDLQNPTSLVMDKAGNLYGTDSQNASGHGPGSVFQLSPPAAAGGDWTEITLHVFTDVPDGDHPVNLMIDSFGNLFGVTQYGGRFGNGTIFELSPPTTPGGAWTETILEDFSWYPHGVNPSGPLLMDELGNLYGTTPWGGDYDYGVLFELVAPRAGNPNWVEKVLYSFGEVATGGKSPDALILRDGIFYGTTSGGGDAHGTVFQLTHESGTWQESTLYRFSGQQDGGFPTTLIRDAAGNLFGGTSGLENAGSPPGKVFELSPPATADDSWQFSTLYTFPPNRLGPVALALDSVGNIYGTASAGPPSGFNQVSPGGVFFRLTPPATPGGDWNEIVLHNFGGTNDGFDPIGSLIHIDGQGFYGVTAYGGVYGGGTVYNFIP